MNNTTLESLAHELWTNGGFSHKTNDGSKPTKGYMVSLYGFEQLFKLSERPKLVEYEIQEFVAPEGIQQLLELDSVYLGGWTKDGYGYLDISINIGDLETAKTLGRVNKQIAIFDVVNFKDIEL